MTTPKEQSNPVALYMAVNLHNKKSYATSRSKSEAELYLMQSGLKNDGIEAEVVELYEVTPDCNAVAAVALMRAAELCDKQYEKDKPMQEAGGQDNSDGYVTGYMDGSGDCGHAIRALIPANHIQAVRELMLEAAKAGAEYGAYPNDDETFLETLEADVDRILAEKGLVCDSK